ncbi:hypothetical protein CQ057_22625 [Ochrobactrum sp. MYb49]|nr:hypothetical protein CQ057_22625 [Ochrobactrum sp. MYb49]
MLLAMHSDALVCFLLQALRLLPLHFVAASIGATMQLSLRSLNVHPYRTPIAAMAPMPMIAIPFAYMLPSRLSSPTMRPMMITAWIMTAMAVVSPVTSAADFYYIYCRIFTIIPYLRRRKMQRIKNRSVTPDA